MSSIIPGFEYDIFISYRQKDNKGDRWVSEFVEALMTELESTFKEEISVYFDINPHDGLLETHDVDESLKEKLKCLVFIPIISRTYCDPNSFAWEHEFKAFVEQASQDQFGLKVKLPNGNVASRVLPVRIYDLDISDIKLCESVLGGVLRGVEFIYAEPGVNRPLKSDDDEKINLNKTKYRNQINKVGNAIKEIIQGLKAEPLSVVKKKDQPEEPFKVVREDERKKEAEKPVKSINRRWLSVAGVVALLIIVGILAYPKIFKQYRLEKLRSSGDRISVAVMPFRNMTNDTTWNVWQKGIQDMLITSFSNSPEELVVRHKESINSLIQSKDLVNYASITPAFAGTISQKLDANVFIYGNIKQAGSTIRVYAQLIDSKTEEVFKSFLIEDSAKEENIFKVIDSLSLMVKDFLILSKLIKEGNPTNVKFGATTKNPEAYKLAISGDNAFFTKRDYPTAINMYSQAIAIDSNYMYPAIMISYSYWNQSLYETGKKWCQMVYERKDQMPILIKSYANIIHAMYYETPNESIKYQRQLLEIDNQLPDVYTDIGFDYNRLEQYNRAIPELEKALEIYEKWGIKPLWSLNYTNLGEAYHETGQYKKERELYAKAQEDFPDDLLLLRNQYILTLTEKDTIHANEYAAKGLSILRDNSFSEADILTIMGNIYSEAGILDRAEEYHRDAFSLEPEKPVRLNDLAYFLIYNDRNVNQGMELVEKALELRPDYYIYLHTKGWGLYKQGKYQESLDLLQKSWDLRREKAIYDHEAFLHLEAAKRAVASQKNN